MEEQLINEFRATRDPEIFGKLVAENAAKVRGVIYKIVLNHATTDDVAQEAFIAAYQKFDSFRGGAKFSTWLCRIAVNKALTHLRRQRPEAPLTDAKLETMHNDREKCPHQAIVSSEHSAQVDWAMRQLPDDLRTTIVLNVIEEMDIGAIAEIMACPKATVYWRLHQARKTLKLRMNDYPAAMQNDNKILEPC